MIKFPKTRTIKVYDGEDNEFEIHVRPYLLNSDIETIESQVVNLDSKQQRRNIVEVLVMRFCTDIEDFSKDELDVEILDAYRVNGIIERVIDCLDKDSYFAISELVNIDTGDELRTIKLLVNSLIDSVDKIEDGTAQKSLENAIDSLKSVKSEYDNLMKPKPLEEKIARVK